VSCLVQKFVNVLCVICRTHEVRLDCAKSSLVTKGGVEESR